ncbi:uncharacterized protein ACLA_019620 [Aspergillus clavatus NRRL 1]|uniref:Ubiquitin family protein n=1 Tax=Aspergillus clavatus (strain ATCC 1007 / CBS 513.65 / DSM 816 / NCTC 3887 / NRRL 1 / QM 1276 / 107) TaxID=344612 RepID=A1CNN6_ASPCL|nr:ubiquitin family protein [Aspergillus clavatus NRRL 1]EAW07257.1 ubiquitin family protein [Aspergillus clavatus NRRL 1]
MASNPSPDIATPENGITPHNVTLHVLCPSLESTNRFTYNDLPLSTTVGALKARLTDSIPGRPPPHTQRLIFRGRALLDDAVTLQTSVSQNAEYSLHLALPPPSSTTSVRSAIPSGYNSPATRSQQDAFASSGWAPPAQNYGQTLRHRGGMPPVVPHEAELSLALQRNIEIVRRNVETLEAIQQNRFASQGTPNQATSTTGSASRPNPSNIAQSSQLRTGLYQSGPFPPTGQPSSLNPAPHVSTDFRTLRSWPVRSWPAIRSQTTDSRVRLELLQLQVAQAEDELRLGIAPPADRIIRIRNQLCELLDDQYSDLNGERNGAIESLLTRIFNVYSRADQLRITHSRLRTQTPISTTPANSEQVRSPIYLVQSRDGYQGVLASPGASNSIQATLDSLRTAQTPETATIPVPGQPAGLRANPEAVVMENAVRQAVLNQRAGNDGPAGLSRHIRRIWLFVRLYFFCYMFSDSGTWLRVVYVTLAVVISLLSETSYPRHLYNWTIAPVQRHLEGLVHWAPDTTADTTNRAAAGTHGPGADRATLPGQLRQNLRQVERSLALFLASLVPGVGERHIEVRNAAEAARNAQLAREEEERHRQQETEDNTEQQPTRGGEAAQNEQTAPAEENALAANELDPLIPPEDN